MLDAGACPCGVECRFEGLRTCGPGRGRRLGLAAHPGRLVGCRDGFVEPGRRRFELAGQLRHLVVEPSGAGPELVEFVVESLDAHPRRGESIEHPLEFRVAACPRRAPGGQLAPHLRGAGHRRTIGGFPLRREPVACRFEIFGGVVDLSSAPTEFRDLGVDLDDLVGHLRGLGFEGGDHLGGHLARDLAFETTSTLRDERPLPACPFTERVAATQGLGEVLPADGEQFRLGREQVGVELREDAEQIPFVLCGLHGLGLGRGELGAEAVQVASGQVDPQRPKFIREPLVAARGVGLALQRSEFAGDLASEVLETREVRLGRRQPPFGLLLASPELQHPCGFLDDQAPFLGAGIEDRVDLTLRDDDVPLPSHARVAEQFLDVEQPAGRSVDRVLRIAAAEQRPGDRHLGELDRQETRRVVDRQRHLGTSERGLVRGAGEDDVVHLRRTHRGGRLGAEHPADRVDDVRLPAAVRSHHDRDPGLHLERRGLRERLETFQRQGLEEHGRRS